MINQWMIPVLQGLSIICALLFAGAAFYCVRSCFALCPYDRKYPAFADLLPYLCYEGDGVILLKNGFRMSVYELSGIDDASMTPAQINHVCELIKRFLMSADGRFTLHFDLLRSRDLPMSSGIYHGDQNAALLNESHQRLLVNTPFFKNKLYLSVSCKRDLTGDLHSGHNSFVKERDAMCTLLDTVLSPNLLITKDGCRFDPLLTYLKSAIFCKIQDVASAQSQYAPLDAVLGSYEFNTGFIPKLNGRMYAVVALDAYPADSVPGMMLDLSALPFEYRFCTRFKCFDTTKSAVFLRHRRRLFEQRLHGFFNQIFNIKSNRNDKDALKQIDDIEEGLGKLNSKDENFGSISQVCIIPGDDLPSLKKKCLKCINAIEDAGFTARIETINAVEAYLGSLPGECECNLRRPLINISAVPNLIPLYLKWQGENISPCKTYIPQEPLLQAEGAEGGIFRLNLHSGDLGNTLVSGPPGSGKSVLLNAIIHSLLRYKNMKIWAFERGHSLYALCRKLNGEHVLLDGSVRFCPLEELKSLDDFARARSFIRILANGGARMNADAETALNTALHMLCSEKQACSLSDLYLLCSGNEDLKLALKPYLLENGNGILDGTFNPGFKSNLNVFECASLLDRPDDCTPVLIHLLSKIRRECESNSQPKALILDEAWLMLKNGIFLTELISWLKTLRKHNTLVIIATQSLLDLSSSNQMGGFLDCIKTRIYLPNPDACQQSLMKLYTECGLNETQIKAVAAGIGKKEAFLQKDGHFCKFSLLLSDDEKEIFTLAGSKALEHSFANDDPIKGDLAS